MDLQHDTRPLLLTDVVGSTDLAERLGDAAMAAVWAAHDRAARALLPLHHGREIDKTDGMLLLFERAADAAAYAAAYHRALAALPVPLAARAGLHVGPVILRENPPDEVARGAKPLEVDGLAKPIVARVMSLAGGGQTLVTPDALATLQAEGALAGRVHGSHGHWMLKGVADPVELFEIGDDASRFAAPKEADKAWRVVRVGERWLPVREIPNNLPQASTSFVGRERELADLKARLAGTRMITLLGMGGLGKTRLSLQLAAETLPRFPDGAWFVDLSALRDPALVVPETARVLDVAEEPGRPLIETLAAQLRSRRLLLVLDNCEHLLDAAGDMAWTLLKAAAELRIVASSRELLDVPGEQAWPIQPLPVPGRGDDLATLERSTAVRLFVERVRAHRPDFGLDAAGAPDLAELVARLEGIPLAIELAAARMRELEVAEISAGLVRRYEMLRGGSRRLQPRQQTLQALVDWSYDALAEAERRVFERLGVCVGGCDEAAAIAVCADGAPAAEAVPALLQTLVDKSLVQREARPGEAARLRMLETLRDYACDRLAERGEAERAAAAARHCLHFFAFAKEGAYALTGAEQPRWLRRFELELDNLRAAQAAAQAGTGGVDRLVAIKLPVALIGFWQMCGHVSEGRRVVDEALALAEVQSSPVALAWGLYAAALLAGTQGEHARARERLERCLALRRELANPVQVAATLSTLALEHLQLDDPAAAEACETEALALFREAGDAVGEVVGLVHLGQIALARGDADEAGRHLADAAGRAAAIGHQEALAEAERLRGQIALYAGELAPAHERYAAALAVSAAAADRHGEAQAWRGLGRVALAAGNLPEARRQLDAALVRFDEMDLRADLVVTLEDLAEWQLAAGDPEAALTLASAIDQARQRLALPRSTGAAARWQPRVARMAESAGGQAAAARDAGRRLELAQALALARSGAPSAPA